MKKFLLGTVGLIAMGMAAPASAADLAARPYTKAPPAPVAVVYDWTGFYIGLNGGGGSAHHCWDFLSDSLGDLPGPEGCHNATGGTAGGQIGYRWETSNWVWGIEGQGNWANFRGSNVSNLFAPDFNRSDRCLRVAYRSGRLRMEQRLVLCKGWWRRHRQQA
jgi:outer membrane immunogenic protein